MDLVKRMKERIAQGGSNKKEILYFKKDSTKRVRFLQELSNGCTIQMHNDFQLKIMEICHDPEEHESCKLCNDGIFLQDFFAWSVWDYDSSAVRLLMFKASGITPIPAFIEMFEEFGTVKDRDYKIKKVGEGQGGSFVVTPLDKERFKNPKAKAMSDMQVQEIMSSAYGSKDISVDDEEDEEEEIKPKSKKDSSKKKKEKTLRSKFEELELTEIKEIALEIGLTKKELKGLDEEEILDELFDNYEEVDLKELLEEMEEE